MDSRFRFFKGNVAVLTLCYVLKQFGNPMISSYLPLYVLSLGGNAPDIGLVNAIGALASLVLYPIGGYIADHKGRVKLIVAMSYVYSFTSIPFILARNWETLAIGRFTQNLLFFYMPAMQAVMADSLPPSKRGIGYAITSAIPGVAGIISPYIAGYLITRYGIDLAMRTCYTITLAIGLLVATIRFRLLKETLKESESSHSLRDIQLLLKSSYKSVWHTLKWMPKNLRSIFFISAFTLFFTSIAAPFWIVYVTKIVNMTPYEWGFIILISGILRISLSIPIGSLLDRYGKKRMVIIAFAISIFPTLFFVYSRTFLQVLINFILISFANAIILPAFPTFVADIVPKEKRGRIMAAFGQGTVTIDVRSRGVGGLGFVSSITCMLGSLISGYIYEANPQYPWFFLSSALFVCLILTVNFVSEPKKPEH